MLKPKWLLLLFQHCSLVIMLLKCKSTVWSSSGPAETQHGTNQRVSSFSYWSNFMVAVLLHPHSILGHFIYVTGIIWTLTNGITGTNVASAVKVQHWKVNFALKIVLALLFYFSISHSQSPVHLGIVSPGHAVWFRRYSHMPVFRLTHSHGTNKRHFDFVVKQWSKLYITFTWDRKKKKQVNQTNIKWTQTPNHRDACFHWISMITGPMC